MVDRRVSVLTPSIPERERMLEECMASVKAQTYTFAEHLVGIDEEHRGCSWTMNQLAKKSKAEWLLPLADDDLLLPGALARLIEASEQGDVIYSPPLVSGNEEKHFFGNPPAIPSFALVRRTLWQVLGGYDVGRRREEDRDLWTRALEKGARFVRIPEAVWVYRFHGGNKSYNRGIAS